jgi:hypothetical protein
MCGPCSLFPVLTLLVPPRFCCLVLVVCLAPVHGVLCPCPCPHPDPDPGPGPCTPPSTLQAVARSGGGGCWVVVLAVVFVPVSTVPAFPMPLAPSSCHPHPWCSLFPPHEQLLMAGSSGCCCAGRHGCHLATGWG